MKLNELMHKAWTNYMFHGEDSPDRHKCFKAGYKAALEDCRKYKEESKILDELGCSEETQTETDERTNNNKKFSEFKNILRKV